MRLTLGPIRSHWSQRLAKARVESSSWRGVVSPAKSLVISTLVSPSVLLVGGVGGGGLPSSSIVVGEPISFVGVLDLGVFGSAFCFGGVGGGG